MVSKKHREAEKNPHWVTKTDVGIGKIPETAPKKNGSAEEKKKPVLKWEPAPSYKELSEQFKRISELSNEAMKKTKEANNMTKWAEILSISSTVTAVIVIIITCLAMFLAK